MLLMIDVCVACKDGRRVLAVSRGIGKGYEERGGGEE